MKNRFDYELIDKNDNETFYYRTIEELVTKTGISKLTLLNMINGFYTVYSDKYSIRSLRKSYT